MTRIGRRRAVVAIMLAALAGPAIYVIVRSKPVPPIVGIVRATEIRVAPEVGGQLAAIRVQRGAQVRAGDVLAELRAPELAAAVTQARAALDAATASRNNVHAGTRAEELASLAAEIPKAQARLDYAEAQLKRTSQLARDDYASGQSLDQAEADAAAARADVAAAQADHAAAKAGPTKEALAIADAQVELAAAALAVIERRQAKAVLRAPADGVIRVIAAEVGEAVRAGQPVLTIEAAAKPWLSFNAREDSLRGLSVGQTVHVQTAHGAAPDPGQVTELLALGSFAVWQAERAVGDHDRNTVRLRVEPTAKLDRLEPGMTVWLVR
jgi:HlyD family secretion protein